MRICLCLSGQVRTNLDNVRMLPRALAGHDVTYVIDVWDDFGLPAWYRDTGRRRTALPDDMAMMLGPYATDTGSVDLIYEYMITRLRAENPDDRRVKPEAFAFLPEAKSHITVVSADQLTEALFPQHQTPPDNNLKMWYMIHRADTVRQQLETDSGLPFDMVIRLRIDSAVASNFGKLLDSLRDDVFAGAVYTDSLHPRHVGDHIFIATPGQMDICSRYYTNHRLPRYLAGLPCHPHIDLSDYFEAHGVPMKRVPVLEHQAPIRTRLSSTAIAPYFDCQTVLEALADYEGLHSQHIAEVCVLTRLHADADAESDPERLESLMRRIDAMELRWQNRFGAQWLKTIILRKLGRSAEALALYCAEIRAIKEQGGEGGFLIALESAGATALATLEASGPLPAPLLEAYPQEIGCIFLRAIRLGEASDCFAAALGTGDATIELYERLIYSLLRQTRWQEVLQYSRDSADKGLYSKAIHGHALRACAALGQAVQEPFFTEALSACASKSRWPAYFC